MGYHLVIFGIVLRPRRTHSPQYSHSLLWHSIFSISETPAPSLKAAIEVRPTRHLGFSMWIYHPIWARARGEKESGGTRAIYDMSIRDAWGIWGLKGRANEGGGLSNRLPESILMVNFSVLGNIFQHFENRLILFPARKRVPGKTNRYPGNFLP